MEHWVTSDTFSKTFQTCCGGELEKMYPDNVKHGGHEYNKEVCLMYIHRQFKHQIK